MLWNILSHPWTPSGMWGTEEGAQKLEEKRDAGAKAAWCPVPGVRPAPRQAALKGRLASVIEPRGGLCTHSLFWAKPPRGAEGRSKQVGVWGDVHGGSSVPLPRSLRGRGAPPGGWSPWLCLLPAPRREGPTQFSQDRGISPDVGLSLPALGKSHENQDECVNFWEAL